MTAPDRRWRLEHHDGRAAALHRLDPPEVTERVARVLRVDRPAVVLGSTQPDTVVDADRAAASGIEVARRRSGGGAVLLVPGEHVWVDLFVPAGDPLWDDDVVAAADWVGDAWSAALAGLAVDDLSVHRGGSDGSPGSRLVCFAGRGPGEVFTRHRKLVGVSQRRTREWIRAQTVVHLRWDPERLLDVLAIDLPGRVELEGVLRGTVATVPAGAASSDANAADANAADSAGRVVGALVAALPD